MTTPTAWIASLLLLTTGAVAQTSRPAAAPATTATDDGDAPLLAGPTVGETPDDEITGPGRRAARERLAVPPRRWFRFVNGLDLEPAQQREIRAIARDLKRKQRAFQETHGEEIAELQSAARRLTESGDLADAAEVRQQLQALRAGAPSVPQHQQRIWSLLDETQRDELRERLAEARRAIAERQARQREMDAPIDDADDAAGVDERRLRFLRSRQK